MVIGKNTRSCTHGTKLKEIEIRKFERNMFNYAKANYTLCGEKWTLSYTIYLEIGLSAAECPQKHGGCDVTGVNLGYDVHAVIH